MKKRRRSPGKIVNRQARHDYELGSSLVVGLQLSGAETKALRMGHGQLRGAYVTTKDGELWLINATIVPPAGVKISESDQVRSRKILAKRKEIEELIAAKQQGRTLVPTELLTHGRYIKLRLSPGKGLKHYDKRANLKRKDQQRQIQRLSD